MKQGEYGFAVDEEPKEVFKSSLGDGMELREETAWSLKSKEIKARRKIPWIKRFADNLREDQIKLEVPTKDDLRWRRIVESGWVNITQHPSSIERPVINKIDDNFGSIEDPLASSSKAIFCYICWSIVVPGASAVSCSSCTLMAHAACILDAESRYYEMPTRPNSASLKESQIVWNCVDILSNDDFPTSDLRDLMKSLDEGFPAELNLDAKLSFLSDTFAPSHVNDENGIRGREGEDSSKELQECLRPRPSAIKILQTILFKLKPSVKTLSLGYIDFSLEAQQYVIDWVAQNDWVLQLNIQCSTFDNLHYEKLKVAWGKNLISHDYGDNSNRILRRKVVDFVGCKAKPCPFCIDDFIASNQEKSLQNSVKKLRYKKKTAIISLQANLRMLAIRHSFLRTRRVVIIIQRKFRASQFWKKSFAKKVLELRPFRLRIDSLWCIVHDPDILRNHSSKSSKRQGTNLSDHLLYLSPPDISNVHMIGSVPASLYRRLEETSTIDAASAKKAEDVMIQLSRGTNFDVTVIDQPTVTETEIEVVMRMFREGYSYPPSYLPPKMPSALYRGNLILTVTVLASDVKNMREPKQLFRIDLEIKMPQKLHKQKLTEELREEIFNSETKPILAHFNRHYSLLKSKLSPSYLLIPAGPACSLVTFTLSEVTTWPKVVMLAQGTYNIYNQLLWKQAAMITQGIQEEDVLGGPEDPLNTNIVFLQKPNKSKSKNNALTRPLRGAEQLSSLLEDQQNIKAMIKDKAKSGEESLDIKGCSIKWGVIPGSYEDCLATRFFVMTLPTLASPKSRKWIVLLDRHLYFFNTVMDINVREMVPLRHCIVSYIAETENGEDGGIIVVSRTKAPIQSWYLYSPIAAERRIWMRMFEDIRQFESSLFHPAAASTTLTVI